MAARFRFYLNDQEIELDKKKAIKVIVGQAGYMDRTEFELGPFSRDEILPWFPNKFDYLNENREDLKPNIYNFTVWIENRNGSTLVDKRSLNIGFREIKLIEQPLNDGRSFYFNINGLPFFARGINYIPTTLNVGNLTEQKEKFTYLLHQVKDANMNMIRIWGGGMYEIDEFYDLADRLGILIWQDFMYACAMYETDYKNLESAKEEVTYQVRRLQHHPSIAVFSGNNEIEGAISTGWWLGEVKDERSRKKLKTDYIKLFEETIRYTVTNLTTTIPFVASSPTNNDGLVFLNSTDPRKGDIHFYDYAPDCLNESKYPRARFVSEYGFQSYPSISTFAKSVPLDRLLWPLTPEIEHRQHAPNQNPLIMNQLIENFNFDSPTSLVDDLKDFEEFTYLTQVLQALSVKLEAEKYLSDRDENLWRDDYSLRSNVNNLNMGSLIWQLNDVWEAPTWSSIDYHGNYKILQYFIRKFYNLVHVVGTKEEGDLVVTLINDSLRKVKIKYYVIFYRNEDGYLEPSPAATIRNEVELDKLTVFKQTLNLDDKIREAGCDKIESCFVRIDYTYFNEYLDNFCLLGRPVDLNLKPVEVRSQIVKLAEQINKYVVIVSSDKVALFVELSWKIGSNIEGHFIDNGFNLLKEEKYILFETEVEYDVAYLSNNLQIRTINKYTSEK